LKKCGVKNFRGSKKWENVEVRGRNFGGLNMFFRAGRRFCTKILGCGHRFHAATNAEIISLPPNSRSYRIAICDYFKVISFVLLIILCDFLKNAISQRNDHVNYKLRSFYFIYFLIFLCGDRGASTSNSSIVFCTIFCIFAIPWIAKDCIFA